MKWKILVFSGVLWLLACRSFSAALPNSYLVYAVQISASESGVRGEPMGSGFILQASNSVYLVTARHVLFDDNTTNGWHIRRPLIEIETFPMISSSNDESLTFNLDLSVLNKDGNARYSLDRDIALVRIESCNPTNKSYVSTLPGFIAKAGLPVLNPIPEQLLVTNLKSDSVGDDVFLCGFPASIGVSSQPQIDPTRPLLRKGIIAGFYPARNTIILDCPVYQGNSGGPVVVKQRRSLTEETFFIIGIAVEWIPFQDVWESKRFKYTNQTLSNSGYSVVERCETILKMVWQ